jgi:uncharacterized protein
MKVNWLARMLLVLIVSAIQLSAQQIDADHKLFEEIKTKAEKGDAEMQLVLGEAYYFSWFGVEQNLSNYVHWMRKAAEQGNMEGQFNLGLAYFKGEGVAKNFIESAKWWGKAAEQGDVDAEYTIGVLYYTGTGMDTNYAEAVKWWRKSAEQGNAQAQAGLGGCYNQGKGVAKDGAEALKWFRKAAEQGNDDGQFFLGASYAAGIGMVKDYVEAYKWSNLSAAQGNQNAKKVLRIIEKRMTPEQIAEAQQLSREFFPRKEIPNSDSNNSMSPKNSFATGTGFFITDDGYLISNYHVVKDATKVRLLTGAGLIDAKVVQVDAANDLALLKADGKFSPLPVSSSRSAQLGGTVATVGFPDIGLQGFAPKLAKGEIASLSGAGDDPRYFQISAPVQPGNSGGALVDERGNVIGIVSAKLDASVALAASGALPENVNYAVKSSLLLSFLESAPGVEGKLKAPNTEDESFENVVKEAQQAAVLVLVY